MQDAELALQLDPLYHEVCISTKTRPHEVHRDLYRCKMEIFSNKLFLYVFFLSVHVDCGYKLQSPLHGYVILMV